MSYNAAVKASRSPQIQRCGRGPALAAPLANGRPKGGRHGRDLAKGRTLVQAVYTPPRPSLDAASSTPAAAPRSMSLQEPQPLLAHEVVRGTLVRYSEVHTAVPTVVLVHGILGSRRNMQGFAKRLVEGFPSWQVVLVDLRCHGESAALGLRGPHNNVESAAADITRLLQALKMFPEVLIGHSFGGKVVMSIAEQFSRRTARLPRPVKVWVLDALPGEVRSGEMGAQDRPVDLITMLQQTPLPVPDRHWMVQRLEAAGFSTSVAAWAATNLVPLPGGGMGWGFDLAGIGEMYRSYETCNLWHFLERSAEGIQLSFVRAERSTFRWGGGDEDRIRALGHAVHMLHNSGHWVHTDNPAGLFDILAPTFGSEPDLHMQRSPRDSSSPAAPAAANNIVRPGSASARQLQAMMQ